MSVNPFEVQLQGLNSSVYLSASSNYLTQIHFLQGGLGLILLMQIVILILRYKNSTIWFYKLGNASGGSLYRFIVPNSIVLWTTFSIIFGICIQGFMYTSQKYANVGADLNKIMEWRCYTWLPLWFALLNMSWATFLAPILANQSKGRSGSFFSRNPVLVNSFFISVPILFVACLLPFSIPVNTNYNKFFSTYQLLEILLSNASALVNSGVTSVAPVDLQEMQQLSITLESLTAEVIKNYGDCYAVYAAFIGIATLIFAVSAIKHFKSLGNSMNSIKNAGSEYSQEMRNLTTSYRSLVFTSSIVAIMTTVFFTLNLILAIKAEQVSKGGLLAELVLLTFPYLFFIFGGISTISILAVSIKGRPTFNNTNATTVLAKSHLVSYARTRSQVVEIEMDHQFEDNKRGRGSFKNEAQFEVDLVASHSLEKVQPFYI